MSTTPAQREIPVTLEPEPAKWKELLNSAHPNDRAGRFREELGLPTDQPIVMSGHQAEFWHPGILAKLFAAKSLAQRTNAHVVWLVVDIDTNDPFSLRVPVRENDEPMREVLVDFQPNEHKTTNRPTGLSSAPRPAPIAFEDGAPPANDSIASKVRGVHDALARHADVANAATQVTAALFDQLKSVIERPIIVSASALAKTTFFREIVDIAKNDPNAFTQAYNDAVQSVPDSGMTALSARRAEVPLWRTDDRGRRVRAVAEDLAQPESLLPTGLLMSGMMRTAGCDLFIHGTGGSDYEPVNDHWLGALLDTELAPFVSATATLTLDFDGEQPVSRREVKRAVWEAHHARHQPAMLDEDALQRRKLELVRAIEALPMRSLGRAETYQELQSLLHDMRTEHAGELSEFDAQAREARRLLAETHLRQDRTWSVLLHDPSGLRRLSDEIDRAFEA